MVTDANLGECTRQNQIILSVLARPFVKQTNHFVYHRSNRQNLMVKLIVRRQIADIFISNLPLANFSFFFLSIKISFVMSHMKNNRQHFIFNFKFCCFYFQPSDQPVHGQSQSTPLTRGRFLKYSLDDQLQPKTYKRHIICRVKKVNHLEQASLLKTSVLWARQTLNLTSSNETMVLFIEIHVRRFEATTITTVEDIFITSNCSSTF